MLSGPHLHAREPIFFCRPDSNQKKCVAGRRFNLFGPHLARGPYFADPIILLI